MAPYNRHSTIDTQFANMLDLVSPTFSFSLNLETERSYYLCLSTSKSVATGAMSICHVTIFFFLLFFVFVCGFAEWMGGLLLVWFLAMGTFE